MKKNILSGKIKKITALTLSAMLTTALAACGNSEKASNGGMEQKEFVYVPEYITIGNEEDTNFYNMQMKGNSLYYTKGHYDEEAQVYKTTYMEYSLETQETKELPIKTGENRDVNNWVVDKDGNFYTIEYCWGDPSGDGMMPESTQALCKYDAQGAVVYEQDITKIMQSDENNSWVSSVVVDEQGHLYMTSDNLIRLFDEQGNLYGEINQNNGWIQGIGVGRDGKVYISYYDNTSADGGYVLTELDYQGKKLGQSYTNFPNGNGNGELSKGITKDFLVSDSSKVYEYDLTTQTYEVLFDWLDSDINGTYVDYVGALENGKLLAVIRDWNTNETELAYLTKTASAELPQKQQLVVGTLYENQAMQAAAVAFNKNSEKYRITIKTYIDQNNWTETSWQDGITALNNDIISKTNCPDILDLTSLNVEQLAAKGVLEDLSPYLEKSTVVKKEDFLESIINGYTFDGKLICIPSSFQISTIAAKTADVGAEMGWTMEEMMAYAEANPDATLFDSYTKASMVSLMLMYNQGAFVNWETGECGFDSEEFKQLLAFANTLPAEYDWESDQRSTPTKIQAGEVLLNHVYIYDLNSIQEYEAMFNEPVTYIGYPNDDGTSGCYMSGSEMYAIASKSENKEGAWAFIENYLTSAPDSMFSWGLSTNKKILEESIAEATKVGYVLDENGQPVLDEDGNPITEGGTSSIGYGDWEYTYHTPTEEEVAKVKELMDVAVPAFSSDNQISTIIAEEVEAYFQGQKTVDDVAGIIQSRVQIYVNENR